MKVALNITLEVDPEEWADEWGIERAEVRDDVRRYARTLLDGARVSEDGLWRIV